MSKYRILASLLVLLSFSVFFSSEAFAQGGRGGRGGGGARAAAGRSSAGRSMPSRPQVHAPSMSRSMPSARPAIQRPSQSINRPSITRRPTTLPGQIGGQRPGLPTNRPNLPNTRPDFGGINNRPNLPDTRPDFGGINNRPNAPANRPNQGGLRDFLDMPGNNTKPATRPSFAGGNNNPNPGNRIGGDRINSGDININAGNRINVNRQDNVNSIRNNWANVNNRPFGHDHWVDPGFNHPNWHYHTHWDRYPGNWCWHPANWTAIGTWFVWNAWTQPVVYDYGSNVVYRDNYVYINDQPAATTEVYYQQAETIASTTPQVADEAAIEWMPLGVFAIANDSGDDSGMMVQLAVSKEGIIAGTFYNQTTETSRPVEGMVDRETQRAAWKFSDGKNLNIVMETGIDNLTKDDSTALVHFGPYETQTWTMVRLAAPADQDGSAGDGQ